MNVRQFLLQRRFSWVGLSVMCAVVGGLFLLWPRPVVAANGDEKLVTIYDNDANTEQTIATRAVTVRDALRRAKVQLTPQDRVEPSADTPLQSGSYHINLYHARPVTIEDGTTIIHSVSPFQSATQIAAAANVKVFPEDTLQLSQINDFVGDNALGLKVTIKRATTFNLVMYGEPVVARTQAKTVGDMLSEKHIVLAPQDSTSVPAAAPIVAGMTVEVWRNGAQTKTEEQPIAFPIRRINAPDQPAGYRQIQTPGVAGKQLVTYLVTLQNGHEISRQKIQSVVTLPPSEQVEIVGTKAGFSGSFADALARLRGCEAGGHYDRNSGNGYYGAYQYNISTWADYGGYHLPSDAPPGVQDQKAWLTYQARGWKPWPACSQKLGLQDIYR